MKKKVQILLIPIFAFLLFVKTSPVLAVDNQLGKYDLTYYQSLFKPDGGWFNFVDSGVSNILNSLTNFFFGLNKLLWTGFDTVIKYSMKGNIFGTYADIVGNIADKMYHSLFSSVGLLFLAFVVASCAVLFITVSPEKAFKQLFKTFLIIIACGIWFKQSGYFMQVINGATTEIQADISSAGTISQDKLVNNGKGDSLQSAAYNLRSSYFLESVEEPYYLMNYGTTNTKKIKERTIDGKTIDEFLSNKVDEKTSKEITNKLSKVDFSKNRYLMADQLPFHLTVSVNSIFQTLIFGFIQSVISILNLVLQFLAVLIDLLLPIFAILSIFPRFNNMFFGGVKGMMMVLLSKAGLGLIMLSFRLVIIFVDDLISRDSVAGYTGNLLFKNMLLITIILLRKPIFSLMKTVIGMGSTAVKNTMPDSVVQAVNPNTDLSKQHQIDQNDLSLTPHTLDKLNSGINNLADAIKGNPDNDEDVNNVPDDNEVPKENEEELEEQENQTLDNETLDDIDSDELDNADENNLENAENTDNIQADTSMSNPDDIKAEMLENEESIENSRDNVINMQEYQNLTALDYQSENGFQSLEETTPPEQFDKEAFQKELIQLRNA